MDHLNQTATQSLSITIHPAPLSITTTTLPNGTVNSPYNQTVSATGGTPPYTFSLATGSLPTGLNLAASTGMISGTPSATGTFSFAVQVTDSETPAMSASKQLSITINAAVACTQTQTNLCGRFTFGFQGADAMGPVAMGGSILTDGTNVLSGVIDINRSSGTTGGAAINPSPASSFSFDPTTKLGTLTLSVTSGSTTFTVTFALALAPDRPAGRLIAFDPAGTSGILGSGAIGAPDTTAFNAAAIKGNYALSFIGGNNAIPSNRVGMLGIFGADGNCNLTTGNNGSVTVNVAGTISKGLNFTGNCAAIDSATGRGIAGFTFTGTGNPFPLGLTFALYVLNANELFFVGIEPISSEQLLAGFAKSQIAGVTFTNAGVTCGVGANLPCVFSSLAPGAAFIGLITVPTPGTMNFIFDGNDGGVIVSNTPIPNFTYNVQPAGFGTIAPPPGNPLNLTKNIDFVIIGDRTAFVLSEGNDVSSGLVEPQQSTTLASAPVNFLAVSQAAPPEASTMAVAFATFSSSTGPGTVSGVADANGGTPVSGATFTASYDPIAANGRATGTASLPGIATFTFYVVKGGRLVLVGQEVGKSGALLEFGRHGGDILP